jgi:hypothetical protein
MNHKLRRIYHAKKPSENAVYSYETRPAFHCTSPTTISVSSLYEFFCRSTSIHHITTHLSIDLPSLINSLLSGETHLLVNNQLSAKRVESSSDSDSDDDSYTIISTDSIVEHGPAYREESTPGGSFA